MVLLCAILLCISALFVCTSFNIRRQVRQTQLRRLPEELPETRLRVPLSRRKPDGLRGYVPVLQNGGPKKDAFVHDPLLSLSQKCSYSSSGIRRRFLRSR